MLPPPAGSACPSRKIDCQQICSWQKSLSRKLKAIGCQSEHEDGGHELVVINTSEGWPRPPSQLYRKNDTRVTCVKCRTIPKVSQSWPACQGKFSTPSKQIRDLWPQLASCHNNQVVVAEAWGTTVPEIEKWVAKEHTSKRPAKRAKVWTKNLTQDGDVEPNPGRCTKLRSFTIITNNEVSGLFLIC